MEIDRDFLCSLSPLFRLNDVKIYWCDQVNKVGTTNSLRPRILIISSSGIYLIHKKSFVFQSRIITSISFFDLVSLYVAGDCASFSSRTNQIRVKHKNMTDVAFLAFFIRQMQFPTDILPLNVTLSNKNKDTFNVPPYQPESLFLDRLLSCIMHSNVMVTNTTLQSAFEFFPESSVFNSYPKSSNISPQISPQSSSSLQFTSKTDIPYQKIVESKSDNSHVYTFTNDILNSPLQEELIMSLAYEQNVDTLKFTRIKLSSILPKCGHLIRFNRFIQTVCLIDVDIDGSENILSQMFSKPHGLKPTKWVFDSCDLSHKSFNVFFDAISMNGKKITHLQFINCIFSNELTFPNLLQSIFFNDGLHALQHLIIDNCVSSDQEIEGPCYIQNLLIHVSEILCCSWAMEQKCFHQLSVTKSGSDDCSLFLSHALDIGVGLEYVNLSQNNFASPLKINGRCELKFLGLRNCILSVCFLKSFVELLAQGRLAVRSLDLSGMKKFLNTDEFTSFLLSLQEVEVDGLETLLFDNNMMNSNQTSLFTNFLKAQKKLVNLSINCSINIKESPNGLLSFISYASAKAGSSCPLKTLSIEGDKSMVLSFERLLKPLLNGISESIQNLDITGQKVGQECLEILMPLIEKGQINELLFDGSNVKSFDFLCHFCEVILSSEKLNFASFPEDDFGNIQTNISFSELLSSEVSQMENKIAELKLEFEKRFSSLSHKKLSVLQKVDMIHLLYSTTETVKTTKTVERKAKYRSSSSSRLPMNRKSSFVLLPTNSKSAISMKPELEKLYKECVGVDEDEENDPILNLVNLVENEISFQNLLSEAQEINNNNETSSL